MKSTRMAVISAVAVVGLLAPAQVTSAASHKKQTVKFSVTGDCKGEEEMIEGESEDNCKIVATISSSSPSRKAALEQLNEDDEWDEAASARSKSGKISFKIDATDEDDAWLDGDFTFRVVVAKSGSNKAYTSKEYTFTFTPDESGGEAEEEGSGEASSKQKSKSTGDKKLDAVLDNMDNKNTSYDDNCQKSFGADCKLMFTPTGPNWTKLSAAKWQPMCEKLLKQTADNCKKMYGMSAPSTSAEPSKQPSSTPSGSTNKQPSSTPGGSTNTYPSSTPSGSTNTQPSSTPSGSTNTQPSSTPSGSTNTQPSSTPGGSTNTQPSSTPSGSTNTQPTPSGSTNTQPQVTADPIRKACTTVGITDCTQIVKLITDAMAAGKAPDLLALGKLLGSKMDAFFKAMGYSMPAAPTR